MLQRYVDRRLNKRKIGPKFAQTFVLFLGEDQTHPDTSLLNSNEHTHTHSSGVGCPHLCSSSFLLCMLSCQSGGHSWGEPSVFLCFYWCKPYFIVQLKNGRPFTWNKESWAWAYFSLKKRQKLPLLRTVLCLTSYTSPFNFRSLSNTVAYFYGLTAFKSLRPSYSLTVFFGRRDSLLSVSPSAQPGPCVRTAQGELGEWLRPEDQSNASLSRWGVLPVLSDHSMSHFLLFYHCNHRSHHLQRYQLTISKGVASCPSVVSAQSFPLW